MPVHVLHFFYAVLGISNDWVCVPVFHSAQKLP
jgi:hypothetical protein